MDERFGYTTGTYAAAAAKAALLALVKGRDPGEIEVALPKGERVLIPVSSIARKGESLKCGVLKKSVEEADVTHNMEICAEVSLRKDERIVIDGGKGVGRITKKGLQLPPGEAAINPVPRQMIAASVKEVTKRGVHVVISVPKGEVIAEKTTNLRLGIKGGISIIGTTGIMRPKSLASFKQSIYQQLKVCKENGIDEIVISPGNISEEAMLKRFPERIDRSCIVQSGDYLGYTLKHATMMKLDFVLAGHPGKLAKVLAGHFQTHYSKAPPANDAVIEFVNKGMEKKLLAEIKESPTIEGITSALMYHGKGDLINDLAEEISKRVKKQLKREAPVPTLLFNMEKRLIGTSKAGKMWAER